MTAPLSSPSTLVSVVRMSSTVVGCVVTTAMRVPPVKSSPRLRPRTASEPKQMRMATAEMMKNSRLRPAKSKRQRTGLAAAPITFGLSNQEKLESTLRIARVATTEVNIDTRTPRASRKAKPLTLDWEATKSTPAVISVTALASRIVRKPRE